MQRSFYLTSKLKNFLLDSLFGQSCLGCRRKGLSLCDLCIAFTKHADTGTGQHIYACFDYHEPLIKKAIWNLKYYKKSSVGEELGKLLYEEMIEEIAELRQYSSGLPILVIPVPLSRQRLKERGYNQAKIIARAFCNSSNGNIFQLETSVIAKIKHTLPQAKLTNRTRRLRNLHNAFQVTNSEIIKNRTVILIDDVTTTGGTFQELFKILKHSGAKHVVGFAVAH